jgi:hypothetical protein
MDKDSLIDMTLAAQEIERKLAEDGPQTEDELWYWVKDNLGIAIPRTPVCKGHDSPFAFLAACYFRKFPAVLGMGNRGGGKTFMVALLHWLNSTFYPGIESATFGATEAQSLRCYAHLKNWIYDKDGTKRHYIKTSVMRKTEWRTRIDGVPGSAVEVLPGTPEGVNGPHPQIAHGDEVELMREDTWQESRNMAVSKTLPNGTVYPSMEILTSTRKGLRGRMQQLIDGIQEAKRQKKIPDYELIIWCIFEIAQEQPNCQKAPKEEREARLAKLGRDPCELCNCDQHMKGTWPGNKDEDDKPKPRLLSDVCNGRLFRSRGFLPVEDVIQKFKQNSKATWEAQQECSKPETELNYLQGFEEERHGVRSFDADPANGKIYFSIDWGGTNPHAANWYQLLDVDVDAEDWEGRPMRIKAGSLVVFDEIYIAEIGIGKLARMVREKEARWRRAYPEWDVEARFPDPQGAAARKDFKDAGLVTVWKTTRDKDTQIEWLLREWWEDDKIRVDVVRCRNFCGEAKSWQRDPKNPDKELEDYNHCMSNLRYCTANIRSIARRRSRGRSAPQAQGQHRTPTVVRDTRRMVSGPVSIQEAAPTDHWRRRLGGPGYE